MHNDIPVNNHMCVVGLELSNESKATVFVVSCFANNVREP